MKVLIVLALPEPVRMKYLVRLRERFPQLAFNLVDHHGKAGPYLDDVEAVIAFGVMLSDDIFARGKNIRWVQAMGSGVDGIIDQPSFDPAILVTNMQGIHGAPCAESALAAMFALARQTPRVYRNQLARKWERFPVGLLDGKTVSIVGTGIIAAALGPRCKAMGMKVVGVSGTPRAIEGFDEVLPRSSLDAAVQVADFLVLAMPMTGGNAGMIDARVLGLMKPSAFLINIARGGVIDETALAEALAQQRIAGASLDVFAAEPLPEDHPLWRLENVMITPHLAGFHDEYPERALPILEHNISCYLSGNRQGMMNIVNRGEE